MSARIGIVICNYNKEDYIVNCIKSILASTMKDFDIYVVDNASTDHSVERIREAYAEQVTLIVNQENLGGSGGFNTGLREALKQDYQYLMCVDNDVVFDERAIEELYQFMENYPETGMVGSKVYFMDDPEKIWSYGGEINYERYVQIDHYRNCIDSADIPEMNYVGYVPACAVMARTEVIRKVGIMPEDNFIYLDDMEWGYNFNKAGYKVAVCGASKVWHKGGGRNAGNTFIHYYMWRNRLNFFMKVLPEEEKEQFTEKILTEMFRMIYSVNLKGETNIIKTLMYAFDDAVHHVRGKAAEGKILTRFPVANRLELALQDSHSVIILFNGNYEGLGNIIRNIRGFHKDIKIAIAVDDTFDMEQYPDCEIMKEYKPEEYDAHLVMCSHIFSLPKNAPEDWYIDSWCNIIYSAEDFLYCKSFALTKDLFLLCKKDLLLSSSIESDK